MRRSDIKLANQLESRKGWSKPLVDAVSALIIYREVEGINGWSSVLDRYEFLVTQRVKGAERGQYQAHHGGFMEVTDPDAWAAAARECRQETGYRVAADELLLLTSVGPSVFRSEMFMLGENHSKLHISNVEAEPAVGFSLPLFITDVSGANPAPEIDGEVRDLRWRTARNIIDEYGRVEAGAEHSRFNYFQFLAAAMLYLGKQWKLGQRGIWQPGEYDLRF